MKDKSPLGIPSVPRVDFKAELGTEPMKLTGNSVVYCLFVCLLCRTNQGKPQVSVCWGQGEC